MNVNCTEDDVRDLNVAEHAQGVLGGLDSAAVEESYSILEKGRGRSFRAKFVDFWERVVRLSLSQGLLVESAEMFDILFGWVTTVSSYVPACTDSGLCVENSFVCLNFVSIRCWRVLFWLWVCAAGA